jgi:hypothetical protein
MVAHLEIPRTQWTGKQAALRATGIRWSRGGARGRHAIAKRYREFVDLFERANTHLPSELSDRTRSVHRSSKEA